MIISLFITVLALLDNGMIEKRVITISPFKTLAACYSQQQRIIDNYVDTATVKLVSVGCGHISKA